MYDKKHGTMWFPHFVPGHKMNGIVFTKNDIDGGMKELKEFNDEKGNPLTVNSFLGGKVSRIGLIKKYGFYLCPTSSPANTNNKVQRGEVLGVYVDKGNDLTAEGKKFIQDRFPTMEIYWEGKPDYSTEEAQKADAERKRALIQELVDMGHSPNKFNSYTVEELKDAIKVIDSGKNAAAKVEVENTKEAPEAKSGDVKMGTKSTTKGKAQSKPRTKTLSV